MTVKTKHAGMRYCWAIKVPPSEFKPNGTFFGRMAGSQDDFSYPLARCAYFHSEAAARAFLRDKVVPHRRKNDCRVVRVRIEETIEEVDRFPHEPHLRWSVDGRHFPSRRRKAAGGK